MVMGEVENRKDGKSDLDIYGRLWGNGESDKGDGFSACGDQGVVDEDWGLE